MNSADDVNDDDDVSITLVGAGRMGGALLKGWLALGIRADHLTVIDPQPSPDLTELCSSRGIGLNPTSDSKSPQVLVLAVKPQLLDSAVASAVPLAGPGTLLLSVIAGKTIADLEQRFPSAGCIVRAMPNTPAAVGRGITGVVAAASLAGDKRATVDRLLSAVGRVEWLPDEGAMDAVTAVSGSGPAYVFYLTECLAQAGERAGLEPSLAARLARATVEGAGELMFCEGSIEPAELRRNVTSPGGTTAAGLEVLSGPAGLEDLIDRTVAAAKRRAGELAG